MTKDETYYAELLARILKSAAEHRHVVPYTQWSQGHGVVAFDVELCDSDDLPSGYGARVIISASPL